MRSMTEFLRRGGSPFIHLALQKCPGWVQVLVPMRMIRTKYRNARVVGRSGIKAYNPHDMYNTIKKWGGRLPHLHNLHDEQNTAKCPGWDWWWGLVTKCTKMPMFGCVCAI